MHDLIRPDTFVALKLFNDTIRIVKLVKGSHISIGKYGTVPANELIGRPFFLTFELPDKAISDNKDLRIVPASEINEIAVNSGIATDESLAKEDAAVVTTIERDDAGVEYEVIEGSNEIILRSNKDTIDDASRQTLSRAEIEAIKQDADFSGRDLIDRLLNSHTALNEKSAFSLAKYLKRKTKKYIRGFSVLPLDVSTLLQYIYADKEPPKIMELSEESISLIGSLANVHCASTMGLSPELAPPDGSYGRWLVVDDTGGLIVAAMAERMGILHSEPRQEQPPPEPGVRRPRPPRILPMSASSTTITVIHANTQPNLSVLKYFGFERDTPDKEHPLFTHLKTVSWLQVLAPEHDTTYQEPDRLPEEVIRAMKSGKKGNYYRKIRRWERVRRITDETRAGGFDGLVIASTMQPQSILQHAIPLLRGSAPVVVYSPHIEPLTKLMEKFAMFRRKDLINKPPTIESSEESDGLDPLSLISTTIHTVKMRRWQCLPGRTHPLMTSRGGAEGYIFHGLKALTAETTIVARGKYKRQKIKTVETEGTIDSLAETAPGSASTNDVKREMNTADLIRMDTPPLEPIDDQAS